MSTELEIAAAEVKRTRKLAQRGIINIRKFQRAWEVFYCAWVDAGRPGEIVRPKDTSNGEPPIA